MSPLRIAFVLTAATNGGTESQAALLVRGLVARGIDVEVFLLDGRRSVQDFGSAPVHVLSPSAAPHLLRVVAPYVAAWRLWRAMRGQQYDVVHAVMARAHVLAPLLVSSRGDRPFVVAWRRNVGDHSGNQLYDALERFAARRTDLIVGNSQAVLDYWDTRQHRSRLGYRLIPNGLELWRFQPTAAAKIFLAQYLLVTVGNLRPVKAHSDLIDAAAHLRSRNHDVGVVIVGEGHLKTTLVAQAKEQGVPLEVVGGVTDTRPYLRAAQVYVQPSHREGSSNAVGEALAQGCVVVATTAGDATELVGETGSVVAVGRADLLADAVDDALSQLTTERNTAGVERARKLRGACVMVESHLNIYLNGVNDVRHRRVD